MVKNSLLILFTVILFFSCKDKQDNNAISGKLIVACDESFVPVLSSESKVYQFIYKNTIISSSILPEGDAFAQLIKGDADVILASRDLTENEKSILKQKNLNPETYKIASDAIVIIGHKQRKDNSIKIHQLKEILSGNITQWKELGKEGNQFVIAFDQNNSSNLLGINEKFPLNTAKINVFAAGSQEKVISYVSDHPDAIGIIALSHVSDDPSSNKHLKNIQVFALVDDHGNAYFPWQEDLATGNYPLKRDIYLINKFKSGLGTGFASFILGDDGQRIILKLGLLPATMPGREVIMNK
jgi:phosphate transport system substrate-binding protein